MHQVYRVNDFKAFFEICATFKGAIFRPFLLQGAFNFFEEIFNKYSYIKYFEATCII
jgi:hypothetical protein